MGVLLIKNHSGKDVEVADGAITYTVGSGESEIPLQGTNIVFTPGTNSSFSIPMTVDKMEVTLGDGSYHAVESITFEDSFFMGLAWGVPVMGVVIGLRMVKQLGYHSQDI